MQEDTPDLLHEDSDTTGSESDSEWRIQRHQLKKMRRRGALEGRSRGPAFRFQRRRSAVIGTRNSQGLNAALPLRDVNLFVSRLSPDVEAELLRAHVEEITGVKGTIDCELQPQRYPTYRSFKILIKGMPKEKTTELYKPENWPNGVLVKKWFN